MPRDLVIVSMHEKGFPQADLYLGVADMPQDEFEACVMAPDTFFTMEMGDSLGTAYAKAQLTWPEAKVVLADDDQRAPDDDEVVSIVLAIDEEAAKMALGSRGMAFLAKKAARIIRRLRPDLAFKED